MEQQHPDQRRNRMTNSGFDNAVYGVDNYCPLREDRASRTVWNPQCGPSSGRTTTPAYIECTRADGTTTVASWHQVRYADLIDQYLYLDDLYNGDQWRYQNNSVFTEGRRGGDWNLWRSKNSPLDWDGWPAWERRWDSAIPGGTRRRLVRRSRPVGPTEDAATLTPVSVAAAPHVASLGVTYRYGALVTGLSWSSVFLSANATVGCGRSRRRGTIRQRFRIGMTF